MWGWGVGVIRTLDHSLTAGGGCVCYEITSHLASNITFFILSFSKRLGENPRTPIFSFPGQVTEQARLNGQPQTSNKCSLREFENFDSSRVSATVALDQCMLILNIHHIGLGGIYSQFQIRIVTSLGRASEMCKCDSNPVRHTSYQIFPICPYTLFTLCFKWQQGLFANDF